MLRVNEIFYSVQGEGIQVGLPTVFIRLQGCNFLENGGRGCSWCDTTYAQSKEGGKEMSIEEILKEVKKLLPIPDGWIYITGGEPLIQSQELGKLVSILYNKGYLISIGTNGSLPFPSWGNDVITWCVDIKCPSSGMELMSSEEWFNYSARAQIKFVVAKERDLEFVREVLSRNSNRAAAVLVSPMIPNNWNGDTRDINAWFQEVVEFCKEQNVRFSLQAHKMIWGNKKGV
jgi:7-carboxy-7-deazaguanine synthase